MINTINQRKMERTVNWKYIEIMYMYGIMNYTQIPFILKEFIWFCSVVWKSSLIVNEPIWAKPSSLVMKYNRQN